MKPYDPHRERLKQFLDDIALNVVEVAAEIGLCEDSQIAHAVDEKLRVFDAMFLFQFSKKRCRWVSSTVLILSDKVYESLRWFDPRPAVFGGG